MSIKKQYFKTRPTCKLTFRLPKNEVGSAKTIHIVGDFNKWNPRKSAMKHLKNGDFKIELELEAGREYEFRYLLDQKQWINEAEADKTVPTQFPDAVNSVVMT